LIEYIPVQLKWSGNGQDSTEIRYEVYLDDDKANIQALELSSRIGTGITSETYLANDLSKGTIYYWTIIPGDGEFTGECLSGIWWFKVSETSIVNHAPKITSDPVKIATIGEQYRYEVKAEDSDQLDVLKFFLDIFPENMTIDSSSGIILWKPDRDQMGIHAVTVRVSDGKLFDTQGFKITVISINEPPEIAAIPDQIIMLGEEFNYQVEVKDNNSKDKLSYNLENPPEGMMIDKTGAITWTPDKGQVGVHTITLNVSDGEYFSKIDFHIYVISEESNQSDTDNFGYNTKTSIIIMIVSIIIVLTILLIIMRKRKNSTKAEEETGVIDVPRHMILPSETEDQFQQPQTSSTTIAQATDHIKTQEIPIQTNSQPSEVEIIEEEQSKI